MASGDGWLVRVRAAARPLSSSQLRTLARLATEYGSGVIELTRRANLQLRGVREESFSQLRAALREAALMEAEPGAERQLAWLLDDAACGQTQPIAQALASLLHATRFPSCLPAKLAIVVDGGLASATRADIRVVVPPGRSTLAQLRLPAPGGREELVAPVDPAHVPQVVRALILAYAECAKEAELSRIAALPAPLHARLRAAAELVFCLEPAPTQAARRTPGLGLHAGPPPRLWAALPLGAGGAAQWDAIAEMCDAHGDGTLRTGRQRRLFMPLRERDDGRAALAEAARIGLSVRDDDALLGVTACAGAPACSAGHGETRALARRLSELCAPALRAGASIHVSGCEKGCADSAAADVTLVHGEHGVHVGLRATVTEAAASPPVSLADATAQLTRWAAASAPAAAKHAYERDGAEIYRRSFAIIRSEANLARFTAVEERVAVRLIHTCGMVDLADDIVFSPGFAEAARDAIQHGAPILCDAKMIVSGVTRKRLRADNPLLCFLDDPRVPALAAAQRTTRSAAALSLWKDQLAGAVVAIGNAPTALFRLLELLDETDARPRAVIGLPVGFVGAAESKEALMEDGRVPAMIVRGRRGGSAMTVAAVNALARDEE